VNEQLVLAVTNRAPTLAQYAPELPASVVTLVDRALQQDKAQRWPSVRHMREQLHVAMGDVEAPRSLSAPNPWLERPRIEREGATLAASPELISSITGSAQVSPAVTSASRAPTASSGLLPLLMIGGSLFAVGLVVVAIAFYLLDRKETAKTDPEPVRSAATQLPGSGPPASRTLAARDDARAEEPGRGAPASSGLQRLAEGPRPTPARPRPGQAPRVAPRASEDPVMRPAPSARSPTPQPSARPAAENPFDKRF
jgi:hypothetical protein